MSRFNIPLHHIEPEAITIINKLHIHHYEAYLVGGCVRDLLLNQKPKDFDIATQATPSQVRSLFPNCRLVGKRFRLAHIFFKRKIIEVATFRKQPPSLNAEETKESSLLIIRDNSFGSAYEDAYRRDFTVNGLFYDIKHGRVIDYVDGTKDLLDKKIRAIGDPKIRFREDPIRMLRAIRFSSKLDFEIEENTYKALIQYKSELKKSDPARLTEELYRLLGGGSSFEAFLLLQETGILSLILPKLAMVIKKFPSFLDPYLKGLDSLYRVGAKLETSTLLFILSLPDIYLFSKTSQIQYYKKTLDSILSTLSTQISISKNEAKHFRQILTKVLTFDEDNALVKNNEHLQIVQIQKIQEFVKQFNNHKNQYNTEP